jgi:hypothetical protein
MKSDVSTSPGGFWPCGSVVDSNDSCAEMFDPSCLDMMPENDQDALQATV